MKRICALILCVLCVTAFLTACSDQTDGSEKSVQLTEKQKKEIDLIVANREKWAETSEYAKTYPVNAVHLAELDSGYTVLTVAYIAGQEKNWTYYLGVRGYAVMDGKLLTTGDTHHSEWLATYATVDLDKMSDQELREALEQTFRASMSRK